VVLIFAGGLVWTGHDWRHRWPAGKVFWVRMGMVVFFER
jgi:hypothetical protein